MYQDIILGADLEAVANRLKANHDLRVIVLCPTPDVVAEREAGRGKIGYGSWTPVALDNALRKDTPRLGLWLDTSTLTVAETVDAILSRLDDARI